MLYDILNSTSPLRRHLHKATREIYKDYVMSPCLQPQALQSFLACFQPSTQVNPHTKTVSAGITPISLAQNQLWQQCFTGDNLDTAKNWLLKQNRGQDHSDSWDYVRHWAVNKADLQQRLVDNRFYFQTVREIEITDEQGHTSRREIRCAEDRLVIRAIAQILKPVFGEALSKNCMHLSGNGGSKAAVAQAQNYIRQQPDHQTIKSDVKSYYASIDHVILHQQLHHLLPNEEKLNRLLWNFMRRTVEFGGNYRDVEIGLPLGASLSPLFSALYLSPLDELAKNTPNTFYRRYMDDWVWVFPKKQHLRTTMKKQYGILQALRVAMHPDKTFIGKVKKGFDFLGFHLTPTGVTVSKAALSRHEQKVARLYEQDAKPKRIRAYRLRWLVWAALAVPCVVDAGTVSAHCAVTGDAGGPQELTRGVLTNDTAFPILVSSLLSNSPCYATACVTVTTSGNAWAFSRTPFANTSALSYDIVRNLPSVTPGVPPFPIYVVFSSSGDHICKFSITGPTTAVIATDLIAAKNIPIFGPFGLITLLTGVMWFGRRRRTG